MRRRVCTREGGPKKPVGAPGLVQEVTVAGHPLQGGVGEVAKAHRPAAELPGCDGLLQHGNEAVVAPVVLDAVVKRVHLLLLAFEHLHEVAPFVEEHPRHAAARVVAARGGKEHQKVFVGKGLGCGTNVNQAK